MHRSGCMSLRCLAKFEAFTLFITQALRLFAHWFLVVYNLSVIIRFKRKISPYMLLTLFQVVVASPSSLLLFTFNYTSRVIILPLHYYTVYTGNNGILCGGASSCHKLHTFGLRWLHEDYSCVTCGKVYPK